MTETGSTSSVAEYLQQLWRELLRVEHVEPNHSFLALGGDSMLTIRMLVTVAAKYERELDFDRFFGSPTLATLSDLLEAP